MLQKPQSNGESNFSCFEVRETSQHPALQSHQAVVLQFNVYSKVWHRCKFQIFILCLASLSHERCVQIHLRLTDVTNTKHHHCTCSDKRTCVTTFFVCHRFESIRSVPTTFQFTFSFFNLTHKLTPSICYPSHKSALTYTLFEAQNVSLCQKYCLPCLPFHFGICYTTQTSCRQPKWIVTVRST